MADSIRLPTGRIVQHDPDDLTQCGNDGLAYGYDGYATIIDATGRETRAPLTVEERRAVAVAVIASWREWAGLDDDVAAERAACEAIARGIADLAEPQDADGDAYGHGCAHGARACADAIAARGNGAAKQGAP